MIDLEAELAYCLGLEIARELLLEDHPSITEHEVEEIWKACDGNAWNAPIIHQLRKNK